MEKAAIRCRKKPSKMNMAIDTHGNAPGISRKPGEFGRRRADISAAPGIPITADFIDNAFRVGERMGVGAVYLPDLSRRCDLVKASPADDGIHGRFHRLVAVGDQRFCIVLFGLCDRSKKRHAWIGIGPCRLKMATCFRMRRHDHQQVDSCLDGFSGIVPGTRRCPETMGRKTRPGKRQRRRSPQWP